MCTYLAKRGSAYYFRRMIPAELRSAMDGKREFMVSLGTKDRAEAKRLIPAHTEATDNLLDGAREALANAPALEAHQRRGEGHRRRRSSEIRALLPQEIDALKWAEDDALAQEARREARQHLRESLEQRLLHTTAVLTPLLAAEDFPLLNAGYARLGAAGKFRIGPVPPSLQP